MYHKPTNITFLQVQQLSLMVLIRLVTGVYKTTNTTRGANVHTIEKNAGIFMDLFPPKPGILPGRRPSRGDLPQRGGAAQGGLWKAGGGGGGAEVPWLDGK